MTTTTEPIQIPIEGDATDFIADAKKVQAEMDAMSAKLKEAGVSQSAYNAAVKNSKAAMDASAKAAKGAADANTKITQTTKAAGISITDLRSAYMIAADAARVAGQIWQATGQEFVNYAEQVKNLSRNIGASAEETSRLIQVADDVRVSYSSLSVAMKFAQKNGVEVSIESMAVLADRYNALTNPIEKQALLMKNFGRDGLEMGKLLSKGGDEIRKMSGAIDDSLIMTAEGIKKSDEYQKSLDEIKDSAYAVQIAIGSGLTPAVNGFMKIVLSDIQSLEVFRDVLSGDKSIKQGAIDVAEVINNNGFEIFGLTIGKIADNTEDLSGAMEDNTDAADENAGAIDAQKEAVKAAEDALKDYRDALEAVSQANLDSVDLSQQVADDQRQYEQDFKEANDALNDALKSGEGVDAAQKNLDELKASWHKASNEMIYDMVLAGLSVGGLLDTEKKALDEYAIKAGIKTQADIDEANKRTEIANATVEGILQSEDVLTEQRKINAEELALQDAITGSAMVEGAAVSVAAMGQVTVSVDSATRSLIAMGYAASKTAGATASIKFGSAPINFKQTPVKTGGSLSGDKGGGSMDNGGYGIAGQTYMIGTGAQPETFTPAVNGTFTPANKQGGSTINIVVNNPKKETAEQSIRNSLRSLSYLGVAG